MSIVKMQRIAVIGLDTVKRDLIKRLMDLEAMEITDQTHKLTDEFWAKNITVDDCQDEVTYYEQKIARASQALNVIDEYGKLKKPLFTTRRAVPLSKFEEIRKNEIEAEENIEKFINSYDRIRSKEDELNKVELDINQLAPWEKFCIPLDGLETLTVKVMPGVLPISTDIDTIKSELNGISDMIELETEGEDKARRFIAILTPKEFAGAIEDRIKNYGLQFPDFSLFTGTAAKNLEQKKIKQQNILADIASLKDEIANNANLKNSIEEYSDILTVEMDRCKIRFKFLKTKKTFFIEGWIPEARCCEVKDALDKTGCYYQIRDPEEGENVPVLLNNRKFFKPIEAITEMYSLPAYGSFDPTSIFALWYICFFGMMFSDACYGIIMTAACAWALKKYDLEGITYKMVKGFLYCGVSTTFWGVMYGGWFGDFFEVFAKTVLNKEIDIKPLWFDPLDDPLKLLIFSLALGVVHIYIGMGISAYMKIRDKDIIGAILGEGSWYVTITGAIMWLAAAYLSLSFAPVGKWMTIIGAVMLFVGGGLGKKGFGKVTGGLGNIYNITSYMSDILSYSRILALGLATGVIAQVVNMMGSLFGGGLSGCIFLILVFIVGQVVNFAINVLGAFIHASRLQYVEFFGKFYVDGGEPFDPFRKKTRYIRLQNPAL